MPLDFPRKPPGFNTVTGKEKYEGMAAKLLERSERVCRYLLPMGRKDGNEWLVGSIDGEKGKSLKVNLKKGVWSDFAGQPGGSDLLALWAFKRGVKMHVALDEAAEWLGVAKPKTTPAWVPTATPAQLEAAVTCELLEIAQQHRTDEARTDEDELWWRKVRSTKRWDYFDADGELWVTVCRFERPGEKVIRPWNHKLEDWKWPEGPRPLFNLQQIRTAPDPILLVEGEKCADAL